MFDFSNMIAVTTISNICHLWIEMTTLDRGLQGIFVNISAMTVNHFMSFAKFLHSMACKTQLCRWSVPFKRRRISTAPG